MGREWGHLACAVAGNGASYLHALVMNQSYAIIRGTVILLLAVVGAGFVFWMWLKRSRNPGMLIFRWVLSVALMTLLFWYAGKAINSGSYAAVGGVVAALVGGWMMAVLWV